MSVFWQPDLGAFVCEEGIRFTVFSRHAKRLWLLLFDGPEDEQPVREIELTESNRTGDIWQITVSDARAEQYYVYRAEGPADSTGSHFFNPRCWLLDPYAPHVHRPGSWGYTPTRGFPESGAFAPRGRISIPAFDWEEDRPPGRGWQETVIYETHLRGFTAHESSAAAMPGSYTALIEKIPYLRELGITAIEFLPLHEFDETEIIRRSGGRDRKLNFWGYNSISFFAPNGRYASKTGLQTVEFREMVKQLHRAGIEVIMDVVFNHTAETVPGPVVSLRGLDAEIYYLLDAGGRDRDLTGCGNTLRCQHPVVRRLILDSLRYWVSVMHVDGFRFDLAAIMSRGNDGEPVESAPLLEEIAEEPLLRDTKLIAEPWDAAGLNMQGAFPDCRWAEWNGRFRDDVRRFWRGDHGALADFAARMTGSPDIYNRPANGTWKSVNFITCHDGFTLRDVVSYDKKKNHENGENNRDGSDENFSRAIGGEGPDDDEETRHKRRRRMSNMLATLLLARGTPMILAGDELGRTQKGNNNAYCQDNETSWIDWKLLGGDFDLRAMMRQLMKLRRERPVLRGKLFPDQAGMTRPPRSVYWYGTEGHPPDWRHGRAAAVRLYGGKDATGAREDDRDILLAFNAGGQAATFNLPESAGKWEILLDTSGRARLQEALHLPAESLAVLSE